MNAKIGSAKKLAGMLRAANKDDTKSPVYHLLLGLLENLSGRNPVISSVIYDLIIECSRDTHIVLPNDFMYLLGKSGFGLNDTQMRSI